MSGTCPDPRHAAGGDEESTERESTEREAGPESDVRFTFANERTFLAWSRTALALIAAGLAVVQLLPPFPGLPWGRHLLAVPMIVLGAVLSIGGFVEWGRCQRALSRGEPLPRSALPGVLAFAVTLIAGTAAVLVVLSAILR